MVTTNQKTVEIFNAVLEMHDADRSEVVIALVRDWILARTEPDYHEHIKLAFDS